jgi:hypothetical protein
LWAFGFRFTSLSILRRGGSNSHANPTDYRTGGQLVALVHLFGGTGDLARRFANGLRVGPLGLYVSEDFIAALGRLRIFDHSGTDRSCRLAPLASSAASTRRSLLRVGTRPRSIHVFVGADERFNLLSSHSGPSRFHLYFRSVRDLISFFFRRRALMGMIFLLLASAVPLWADDDKPDPATIWEDWCSEPFSVVLLLLSAAWYALGLFRIRNASPRAIGNLDVICFVAGWLILFIALCSPLHRLGEVLFSAHMIQHELLMLAAAPLLVLARPLPVFLFALRRSWASALARASKWRSWERMWNFLTNPLSAWIIHAAVL